MKKRVRLTLSVAAFLLCFLILFSNIAEILRRKMGVELNMVNSFYTLEENSIDAIFLGSSHLFFGIQPNILWEEHGITSYVMGSPEQSIASSYFLLKEALKYQQPKVVVLESFMFWLDGLYMNEQRLRQAFDGTRLDEVKREMIETFLPELGFKDKLSFYFPFLKYHSRWQELEPQDFHYKPFLKGGCPRYTFKKVKDPGLDIEAAEIPSVNLEYLDKIVALCEENDMELIVFAVPFGNQKGADYERKQGVNLTLETYLPEQEIPFLFYQRTGEAGIDFSQDFQDTTHVNALGAEKITRCMGAYLDENYDLPDHRGDAEYASWDSDYELYLQDIEMKIAAIETEG